MQIKIFRPGCARRRQTEEMARRALAASGVEAEVLSWPAG